MTGCSPYDRRPVALFYHNTTSKYNAYFLGRERMKELETELYKSQKNNYNKILDVYPKIDSNYSKTVKDKLDKIIKNSSLPIQWHKVSHWVDDSYLLIGKCRYYDVDWENAITTFRFINSRFDDNDVKHHALIWLMRVYMEQSDWDGARRQGDYLEDEYLDYKNVGRLSLANGHYYIKQKDYKNAYEKLNIGVKYVKPKDYRSKVYYILGQLGQKIGKDKEAYAHYKKCAKMRPEYEMFFYAKLNMYQMKELKGEKDAEKTMRYYKKLLKDIKNKEYQDRIYYEMGAFEQKREKYDEAIVNYKKSAKEAGKNPFTKAFAYLRTAEIYYENKQEYELSSTYYDSCVAILEKDLPEYPKAMRRQKVLKEFVEQLKIVRLEDSLQKLAGMDSASLNKLIDKWIAEDIKKKKEAEKLAAKQKLQSEAEAANAGLQGSGSIPSASGSDKWYFYNPVTIESGKQDFLRKWGTRPNEDNWRRINKEREDVDLAAVNSVATKDSTSKGGKGDMLANMDAERAKYLENIPFDKVKMDSSHARKKRALFRLGRIYDFSLEEYPNAKKSYGRFVDEYPAEEKVPEAMYAIYLICKNKAVDSACEANYKNRLLNEYPKSLYAKLILNPDYLKENKLLGERIKYLYRNAFEMYESEKYLNAQNTIADIMREYPDNEFEDRFVLLRAMIVGRTQSLKNYKDSLYAFVDRYEKTSKLVPYAKSLIRGADQLYKRDSTTLSKNRVVYDLDLNFPHYLCVTINDVELGKNLVEYFKKYNAEYYTDQKLEAKLEDFGENGKMIVVKALPNTIQAMNYYEKQKGKSSPLRAYTNMQPYDFFVISDKNYKTLVEAKNKTSYIEFFKKNYLKK